MYHNIFDTHSHYDDSKFNPDREELLDNLQSQGVSLVVSCGCDLDSTQFNFDLAQKYDYIYFVEYGDFVAIFSKKMYGDVSHVDAISRMNGLQNGNLIYIGQKLILP